MTTTNTMTAEEVDAQFADVELTFAHYYKYTFGFAGAHADGRTIHVTDGGEADEIYRYEVTAGEGRPFGRCASWQSVSVYDGERCVFSQTRY